MRAWHISIFYVGLAILQVPVLAVDYEQLGNGTVAFDTCSAEDFTNPEYEDYGADSNLCFVDKFPELTKDEKEKRNCCGFDGVVHTTTCDGTDDKNNKIVVQNVDVCQYPDHKDGKIMGKVKLKCPAGCKIKTLEELMLDGEFGDEGEFKIIDSKTIIEKKYSDGYCIAHKCHDQTEDWNTDAEICECNFEEIEKKTKAFISNLKSIGEKNVQSCCGDRIPIELINHGNDTKDCGNNVVCKESETLVIESNENYSKVIDNMNKKVNTSDSDSCVGVTLKGKYVYAKCSVYKQKARKDGHGANRSQKADMICPYLRLFLGMGFIWYFEILSWAVNPKDDAWILTDFLNMMQVFFIFVCKRNVLGVVFGKKSRLYSTVHQASIKLNRGKSVNMARQGSLTTDQSEISQSLVTDKVSVNINPAPYRR